MLSKISTQIAIFISQNGGTKQKINIYKYGIECLLNEFISDLLLIILGILFNQLIEILIWNLSFTFIRIHIGGFHASSNRNCILIGIVISYLHFYLNFIWYKLSWQTIILFFICCILFSYIYAPIVHPNRQLTSAQKYVAKYKTLLYISIEWIIAYILLLFHFPYADSIFSGIFVAVSMACIPIIKQKFNLHKL